MRNRLSDYQEEYGDLYNLEASPAESTTYRLAKHDVARWPDIITAARNENETPYYTNSSHLPVGYTEDVFEALTIQDELQTLYTSGTVFHAFIGEKLPSWKSAANLVRKIANNYKMPYYTLSPTYSICKNHGYLTGEQYNCENCGETTEVYSRITGYYRPVQNWNAGKTQEFKARKVYDVANETPASKPHSTVEAPAAANTHAAVAKPASAAAAAATSHKCTNESAAEKSRSPDYSFMLVTSEHCPNCVTVQTVMNNANIQYSIVDVSEYPEVISKYSVRSAPTLIVRNGEGFDTYATESNIRAFVTAHG